MTKVVNVLIPFTFTHDNGKKEEFKPGPVEMDDALADHWYVLAHSTNPPKYEPKVGTPEYANADAAKRTRQRLVEAAAMMGHDITEEVTNAEQGDPEEGENSGDYNDNNDEHPGRVKRRRNLNATQSSS